ncbi:hypothetical protein E2C01_069449 [Portunus trituberculatus]|uniref:Uncharacterized protein n=1 Tax=Portunus trituberculatus TaxID=210409 RepID=A0A5B7HYX1_PORTR|nr:hypothetical protein [Portunus trituberculatus]
MTSRVSPDLRRGWRPGGQVRSA